MSPTLIPTATPTATPHSQATRNLPATYVPGVSLTVEITVGPAQGVSSQAVEDVPPDGWMVEEDSISDSGTWDDINKKVKWGPFYDDGPRTLTYDVTPAMGGTRVFSGVASFDGADVEIGGDCTIEGEGVAHPADTDDSWMIVVGEATEYGAAWKEGQTWPVPPNPIPMSYAVRAGYLWQVGESYYYNNSETPPLCWMPASGLPLPGLDTGGTAVRSLPAGYISGEKVTIFITVTPEEGVYCYAVEETPPEGWTVDQAGVDNDGYWDSINGKIRWFITGDNQKRTLSYEVTPPVGDSGTKVFFGPVNFDGEEQTDVLGKTVIDKIQSGPLYIRINFQPGWAMVPSGYHEDDGSVSDVPSCPGANRHYGWQ